MVFKLNRAHMGVKAYHRISVSAHIGGNGVQRVKQPSTFFSSYSSKPLAHVTKTRRYKKLKWKLLSTSSSSAAGAVVMMLINRSIDKAGLGWQQSSVWRSERRLPSIGVFII